MQKQQFPYFSLTPVLWAYEVPLTARQHGKPLQAAQLLDGVCLFCTDVSTAGRGAMRLAHCGPGFWNLKSCLAIAGRGSHNIASFVHLVPTALALTIPTALAPISRVPTILACSVLVLTTLVPTALVPSALVHTALAHTALVHTTLAHSSMVYTHCPGAHQSPSFH